MFKTRKLILLPIFAMSLGMLTGCNEEINSAISDIQNQIGGMQNDIDDLKNQIDDLKAQIATLQTEMNDKIAEIKADYEKKIFDAEAEIAKLTKDLDDLSKQLTADKKTLEDDYNSKLAALSDTQTSDKQALQNEYNSRINALEATYVAKVQEIENSIVQAKASITGLQNEMNQQITAIQNDYNAKISDLTSRVATLEQVQTHTVTFDTNGGSEIAPVVVVHGEKVRKPENPIRPGYSFDGWTYQDEPWIFYGFVITENITLRANWVAIDYIVTFKNDDGTVLETQEKVHYGDSVTYHGAIPVKPNPEEHYIYTFNGWDVDITNIVGDTVAVAQYIAEYAPYTAYFLDEDDNVIYTTLVREGETATYVGETPVKESDLENQLQYQFSGWDEVEKTEDSVTYQAHFESCTRGLVFDGNSVYQYTGNSTTVVVPSWWNGTRIISIGNAAFESNSFIKTVVLSQGIETIGDYAFNMCSSLTTITLPETILSVGSYSFKQCSSLSSITLPDSITSIGRDSFHKCSSLLSLSFPKHLETISYQICWMCSSLESIVLPESIVTIESYAFFSCNLKSLDLPNSLRIVGMNSFRSNQSLECVYIPETVVSFGENVFELCDCLLFTKLFVKPVTWEASWSGGCQVAWGYENIIEMDGYTYVLTNNNGVKLAYLASCSSSITEFEPLEDVNGYKLIYANLSSLSRNQTIESVTIPRCIKKIGDQAFYGCIKLKTIHLYDGLEEIGNQAFYNCTSLTSVVIPNSVLTIGNNAFYNCSALQKVVLPNSLEELKYDTFSECNSLKNVIVPDGVRVIGNNCWLRCTSLESVVLPNSLEQIGYQILASCTSLQHVYYKGTEEEWAQITKDSPNDFESKLTFVSNPEHEGTLEDPMTIADGLSLANLRQGLNASNEFCEWFYYKGVVTKQAESKDGNDDLRYVYVADDLFSEEMPIYILKRNESRSPNWSDINDLKVGDEIIFYGQAYYYAPKSMLEFNAGAYCISINGVPTA